MAEPIAPAVPSAPPVPTPPAAGTPVPAPTPQIELTLTPGSETLDQGYARRRLDDEWAQLQREQIEEGTGPEIRGAPGKGTEDVAPPAAEGAAPTEQAPTPTLRPQGIVVAVDTALRTARDGILKAVKPGPLSMASAKEVFDGLVQTVFSPLVGVAAGIGQEVENLAPDLMGAEFLAGGINGPAFTLRHLSMGAPDTRTIPPEDLTAMQAPMTAREALELAIQSAPMAIPGAKKLTTAVKMQAPTLRGERGSVGPQPPPEGAQYRGTGGAGGAAPVPPAGEPPVPPGMVRLYRGEGTRTGGPVWNDPKMNELAGRWFTDDPTLARDFADRAQSIDRTGRLVYVDVPAEVAQKARELHPEFDPGAAPERGQHLLPPDWAAKAQPLPSGGAEAPPRPGIPLPPDLGGVVPPEPAVPAINPRTLGTPAHVLEAVKDLDAFVTERLKTHRARKAHETTVAEAKMSLEKALSYTPETAYLTESEMAAMTAHFEHAAEWYDTVRRRYKAGTATPEQLDTAWAVAFTLATNEVAAGTNTARTLNIRGASARAREVSGTVQPEQIIAAGEKLLGGIEGDARTRADALATMTEGISPEMRRSWFRTLAAGVRAGRDLSHQLWINNILSGIDTTYRNLFGTTAGIGADVPEHIVAEIIRPVREQIAPWTGGIIGTSDPSGVQFGETAGALRGMLRAKSDMIRLVQDVAAGQEPFGKPTPFDRARVRSAEYGFDPESPLGRFVDVLDGALNSKFAPTTWMRLQDAALKGLVYRMEIGKLAVRQATLEGHVGDAYGRRVIELEREPLDWMIRESQDQAVLRTLNQELGATGKMMMGLANKIPLARVVAPFMQTPTNSGKWAVQRLPALSLLSQQNWADLAAGGARADKALARLAVGNGVAAVIAWQVFEGNITGGGHPHPALKSLDREEKPPYSIRIGGTNQWMKCDIDPVCMHIRAVADAVELYQYIPDQEAYEEWAATMQVFGLAFGHSFVHSGMLGNVRDTLNAIMEPGGAKGAKPFLNVLRGTVPNIVRDVTRLTDENIIRDVNSVLDVYKSALPWTVSQVPPIRNNITGEPFRRPSGFPMDIIPLYRYTTKPDDPVMMELGRLRVPLAGVPRSIYGSDPKDIQTYEPTSDTPGTRLSDDQMDFWKVQMTTHKHNGQTLHEALTTMMQSSRYRAATDATKRLQVRAIYSAYKEIGLARLLDKTVGSPTLQQKVVDQLKTNAAKYKAPRGGGGTPQSLTR